MNELTEPFVRAWRWVEQVGGFPGQVFFCVTVVIVILGGLTWYGNRR
jgi:hypothetical protein